MQALLKDELELISDMGKLTHDPYKFVMYSFEWGKGELEDFDGPDEWQTKILCKIRDKLLSPYQAILIAIASGHGPGKTALVCWLILWALSTHEDTRGVVTANTENQLKTKTWAELSKWYRLFIAKHWFHMTATAIYSVDLQHERTWRVDMVPWSEEKTEAFAGLHNKGKRIFVAFDESSAIPDKIWEVTEGSLTDEATEIIWIVCGNPTRSQGRFFDCFNKLRHRWYTTQIDSRTARMTNKGQIQKWIEDYGEDSDFCRVRVRGVFPNISDRQFIPSNYVEGARGKHLRLDQYNFAAKIITLDNAWTGGDEIVFALRQGLAFKILQVLPRNEDDGVIAGLLGKFEDQEQADAVFIDLGYGTGVYSFGKQLKRDWILIPFGGASLDPGFLNKRAEMWDATKQWLKNGGAIPNDPILCADLIGPEYGVVPTGKNAGKIFIESKEDMKKRGLASPNRADALALSFAMPVLPKIKFGDPRFGLPVQKEFTKSEYDVLKT